MTSNLISAGVRESVRFMMQHSMVDVVVCSAGGIEEDFIKCLAPTLMGDFKLKGEKLRSKGLNRIGKRPTVPPTCTPYVRPSALSAWRWAYICWAVSALAQL